MKEDSKSRLRLLIGQEGVDLLDSCCVAVFGLGGVGSNCVEGLVRGGIGRFIVVDGDTVAPSNINRQAIAYPATLGMEKSRVTADFIKAINPDAQVLSVQEFVGEDNLDSLMNDAAAAGFMPNFMVDALDTVTTKVTLAAYAQKHGCNFISSMGGGNKTDPTMFRFAGIYETSVDPLAKAVRKLARKDGLNDFPVLFSTEPPHALTFKTAPSEAGAHVKSPLGTMSYLPPIMGYMIAGYVIEHLLRKPKES